MWDEAEEELGGVGEEQTDSRIYYEKKIHFMKTK